MANLSSYVASASTTTTTTTTIENRGRPRHKRVTISCPLLVNFLIDVSASMSGTPLRNAVAAFEILRASLRDDDLVRFFAFNSSVTAVGGSTYMRAADFDFDAAIAAAVGRCGGGTRMFDAIVEAMDECAAADLPKHTQLEFIVLTDGMDGSAKTTFDDFSARITKPGLSNFHLIVVGMSMPESCRTRYADLFDLGHCRYVDSDSTADALRDTFRKVVVTQIARARRKKTTTTITTTTTTTNAVAGSPSGSSLTHGSAPGQTLRLASGQPTPSQLTLTAGASRRSRRSPRTATAVVATATATRTTSTSTTSAPNCRHFAKGFCRYGDACQFNHPAPTKRKSTAKRRNVIKPKAKGKAKGGGRGNNNRNSQDRNNQGRNNNNRNSQDRNNQGRNNNNRNNQGRNNNRNNNNNNNNNNNISFAVPAMGADGTNFVLFTGGQIPPFFFNGQSTN